MFQMGTFICTTGGGLKRKYLLYGGKKSMLSIFVNLAPLGLGGVRGTDKLSFFLWSGRVLWAVTQHPGSGEPCTFILTQQFHRPEGMLLI